MEYFFKLYYVRFFYKLPYRKGFFMKKFIIILLPLSLITNTVLSVNKQQELTGARWLAHQVQTHITEPCFDMASQALNQGGSLAKYIGNSIASSAQAIGSVIKDGGVWLYDIGTDEVWWLIKKSANGGWWLVKEGANGTWTTVYYGATCPFYFGGGVVYGATASFDKEGNEKYSCEQSGGDSLQCQCAGAGNAVGGLVTAIGSLAVATAPLLVPLITYFAYKHIARARATGKVEKGETANVFLTPITPSAPVDAPQ